MCINTASVMEMLILTEYVNVCSCTYSTHVEDFNETRKGQKQNKERCIEKNILDIIVIWK